MINTPHKVTKQMKTQKLSSKTTLIEKASIKVSAIELEGEKWNTNIERSPLQRAVSQGVRNQMEAGKHGLPDYPKSSVASSIIMKGLPNNNNTRNGGGMRYATTNSIRNLNKINSGSGSRNQSANHHYTAQTTGGAGGAGHRSQARRQLQPQVVISVNCSKAMTVSNYKQLAKMVSKQKIKQEQMQDEQPQGTSKENSNDNSFFSKQKMLESRIEKLRKLESRVKKETVCSKQNCPVSLDPRTTSERYGNDDENEDDKANETNKEMRDRIERFRSQQNGSKTGNFNSSMRKKKDLQDSKEGTFKLNEEGRDIKVSSADEVNFNFMRRHQVAQETADIPLSELIRQNQERAIRNNSISKEKMRRQELGRNSSEAPGKSYCMSNTMLKSRPSMPQNHQYKSHNLLQAAQQELESSLNQDQSAIMSKTFATAMNSFGNKRLSKKSMISGSTNTLNNRNSSTINKQTRGSASLGGSRRNNIQSLNGKTALSSYLGRTTNGIKQSSSGLRGAASLEILEKAFREMAVSPSPELEQKDEFASQSLWQMAAKANQEDFRELFLNQEHQENSDELEKKLRDLINSQKNQPAVEPEKQVSPRTIKYLCNVMSQEVKAASAHQYTSTGHSSIPVSYSRKLTKNTDQNQIHMRSRASASLISQQNLQSKRQQAMQSDQSKSGMMKASVVEEEDQYDLSGATSAVCRPLLKEQKEKLLEILADKKAVQQSKNANQIGNHNISKQNTQNQGDFENRTAEFLAPHLQKSMNHVMQLQRDIDASPTLKAKNRTLKKNEILEICEQQFPAEQSRKANMYGRALKMYANQKDRIGVSSKDLLKPETMAHFHIEAFGDQIEINRYENQSIQKINLIKDSEDKNMRRRLDKDFNSYRSQQDVNQVNSGQSNGLRISINNIQKTKTNLNLEFSGQNSEVNNYVSGAADNDDESQDSVFSSTMQTLRDQISHVMADSPDVPKSKGNKLMKALNLQQNSPGEKRTKDKYTVLMTKETSNEYEYFMRMELQVLARLERQQAITAYKVITNAAKPIFSGSLDHRINMLDIKKVQSILHMGAELQRQMLGSAANLTREISLMMDLLKQKQIYHGYWDQIADVKGCLPEARKGASMNSIGNEVFIFGGFSIDTYNDLKVFNVDTSKWTQIETSGMRVIPDPRVSHTMVTYHEKLILFGGAGAYMPNLHMMPSFNDIWMFETNHNKWQKLEGSGIPPKKRMSHVSAVLGSILLIHGGYNCEGKLNLDDFNLFDIEDNKWLKTRVMQNGKEVKSEQAYGSTIDTEDSDFPKAKQVGARNGHCIASVYVPSLDRMAGVSHEVQNERTKVGRRFGMDSIKERQYRGMWIQDRSFSREEIQDGKEFKEGYYIFGGQNRDQEKFNDLWLVRPEYYTNKRMIDDFKFQYTCRDPELTLNVSEITKFSGQPPCPRSGATMVHLNIKRTNQQLLVIYGGRNDKIYETTGGIALNDICIFNINQRTWEQLAIFGQHPLSRWKHSMVAMNNEMSENEGFMIFGGANLHCYCRSKIFTFSLMKKSKTSSAQKRDDSDLTSSNINNHVYFQAHDNYEPKASIQGGKFRDDVSHQSAIRSSFAKKHKDSYQSGGGAKLTSNVLSNLNVNFSNEKSTSRKKNLSKAQTLGLIGAHSMAQTKLPHRSISIGNPHTSHVSHQAPAGLSIVPESQELLSQELLSHMNQGGKGNKKDYTQLNLGSHYTALQETIRQRLEVLRENITRPKTSSAKKAKMRW